MAEPLADAAPDEAALLARATAAQAAVNPAPAADAPGAPGSPAASPAVDAQQWRDAAILYGRIAAESLPEKYRAHWTDARLGKVGDELANCARHYGWTFGDEFNHPLMRLAAAAFPLAWPFIEPHVMRRFKIAPAGDGAAAPVAASGKVETAPPGVQPIQPIA